LLAHRLLVLSKLTENAGLRGPISDSREG
jgi:hypothetical protein